MAAFGSWRGRLGEAVLGQRRQCSGGDEEAVVGVDGGLKEVGVDGELESVEIGVVWDGSNVNTDEVHISSDY